jgi:hypothetical protein
MYAMPYTGGVRARSSMCHGDDDNGELSGRGNERQYDSTLTSAGTTCLQLASITSARTCCNLSVVTVVDLRHARARQGKRTQRLP